MKSFTALAMSVAVALAATVMSAASVNGQIVQGQPKCDGKYTHCLYLKRAFTYGDKDDKRIVCSNVDSNGHGHGTCQFPPESVTTAQCKNGSKVYVKFGWTSSSFRKNSDGYAIWSSQKFRGKPAKPNAKTNANGDDLYITCTA